MCGAGWIFIHNLDRSTTLPPIQASIHLNPSQPNQRTRKANNPPPKINTATPAANAARDPLRAAGHGQNHLCRGLGGFSETRAAPTRARGVNQRGGPPNREARGVPGCVACVWLSFGCVVGSNWFRMGEMWVWVRGVKEVSSPAHTQLDRPPHNYKG